MKLKNEFLKRDIAGEWVYIPVGESPDTYNGIVLPNETAAFLMDLLAVPQTEDILVSKLVNEFEVDETAAKSDLDCFLDSLRLNGLLAE